jgi:hypothetical protein
LYGSGKLPAQRPNTGDIAPNFSCGPHFHNSELRASTQFEHFRFPVMARIIRNKSVPKC